MAILPTAYAHRIVLEPERENGPGEVVATGVEFSYGEDKSMHNYIVHAKREVIISAGYVALRPNSKNEACHGI